MLKEQNKRQRIFRIISQRSVYILYMSGNEDIITEIQVSFIIEDYPLPGLHRGRQKWKCNNI